jgi:uncharacterized protein (TIGR02646 family)
MKKINKTEPPPVFFTDFIKKHKPNNWGDCIEITAELRNQMLSEEQNYQCAYCESSITSDNSKSHIDHYKRKAGHLFPELECMYNNLLVSCNKRDHCAKSKDNKMKTKGDYSDLINPVVEEPSEHFEYSYTGDILAKDKKAEYTIRMFNLNCESLVGQRKKLTKELKNIKNQFELEEVVSIFGKFESFIRAIW